MKKTANSFINGIKQTPIVIAVVGLMVIMALFIPRFATTNNMFTVLSQMSYLGIATIGLSFVLVGGGNDLSIGSIMTITGVVVAMLMASGIPVWIAVCAALLVGALIGLLNGFFVAELGVNAFMMTLITQMLFEGIALAVTSASSIKNLPQSFISMPDMSLALIPVPVIIMLTIYIIGHVLLKHSVYGRKLIVTGANKKAANLVGINVNLVQMLSYVISGVLAATAGILLTARLGVGSPAAGSNIIMDVISAAVIGGNSLFGGKGSVVGAAFGVLLLVLISNGLALLGVAWSWTMIIKGLVILLAVCVDIASTKVMEKKMLAG